MSDMQRSLVFCLLPALAAAPGCGINFSMGPRVAGSGKIVVETREATGMNAVEASGVGNVEIAVGDAESLAVEGDDNLLEFLHTEVQDGVLKIWHESGSYSWTKGPKIVVNTKSCDRVNLSGATTGSVSGVTGAKFAAHLSGATKLQVSGRSTSVDYHASGASNLDASGLAADSVSVDCSGASSAKIGSAKSVAGSASGASSITAPKGAETKISTSGASNVNEA